MSTKGIFVKGAVLTLLSLVPGVNFPLLCLLGPLFKITDAVSVTNQLIQVWAFGFVPRSILGWIVIFMYFTFLAVLWELVYPLLQKNEKVVKILLLVLLVSLTIFIIFRSIENARVLNGQL